MTVIKRNGSKSKFDENKILTALKKCIESTYPNQDAVCIYDKWDVELSALYPMLLSMIVAMLPQAKKLHIEQIQDIVEKVLISVRLDEAAKAYIIYRENHRQIRENTHLVEHLINQVDKYIQEDDWLVKENANMSYSLQGLNNYIISAVSENYWMNKIYPKEVNNAHKNGYVHVHDAGLLSAYCAGWSIQDFLNYGFTNGNGDKVDSKPAKHFSSALGIIVNALYTLQCELAGAQAISNVDTILAPYIHKDKLTYDEVKQKMQEHLFNLNVPTRIGSQSPFTNYSFDLVCPVHMRDEAVTIGGDIYSSYTYKDFQDEMNMINRAFCEVMLEGDAKNRSFPFPIPTYAITKDFDWSNEKLEPMWEMTGKYGTPYFANYVNSDMDPADIRSMCCRLRLSIKTLYKRPGSLFGAAPLTGSIGVVTLNIPLIAYEAKGNKDKFFKDIEHYMRISKESLEIKRKQIEKWITHGLYPYSRNYLHSIKEKPGSKGYYDNHFSTIATVGINEATLNLLGIGIDTEGGYKLANELLEFMKNKCHEFQVETGNLYNLEQAPAEKTAGKLAQITKDKYPDSYTQGNDSVPYYTNSSHLPVNLTDDLHYSLVHQQGLNHHYTGGTAFHIWSKEKLSPELAKILVKRITEKYSIPYFTYSPVYTICPVHGYIEGEHQTCPYYRGNNNE